MWIAALTFLATLGVVIGAYWVFVVRPDDSQRSQLRSRLNPAAAPAGPAPVALLKAAEHMSHVGGLDSLLGRAARVTVPLQRSLIQAGLPRVTVAMLLLASACLGVGTYLGVKLLLHHTLLGIGAGVLVSAVPFVYVRHRRTARLRKFEEQFPEAIDLIGRALRAGHAFTTGLAMAAEEIPAPVGEEFKLLYDRQSFGMPLPEALRAFAARIPLIDARFFATAVLTQRETGGNLGEILDNLTGVIRERFKVKRQVRVLTAHGRITGWVLAGLPPVLAAAIFAVAPGHLRLLTGDPLGVQMIVGALVLQIVGTITIRKLVNIRY